MCTTPLQSIGGLGYQHVGGLPNLCCSPFDLQIAGEHTEAALNGKVPLNVPEFKNFIMPAVIRALDEWRTEAEQVRPPAWGRGQGVSQVQHLCPHPNPQPLHQCVCSPQC